MADGVEEEGIDGAGIVMMMVMMGTSHVRSDVSVELATFLGVSGEEDEPA